MDLVELAHAVEDVVGAGEVLALADRVDLVRRRAALVVEAAWRGRSFGTFLNI